MNGVAAVQPSRIQWKRTGTRRSEEKKNRENNTNEVKKYGLVSNDSG